MIKIINQQEIPILSRKILTLNLSYTGTTPKKDLIKREVADFLKTKPDLIVLKKTKQRFGEENADVIVHVYEKLEDLKKIEEIKKKVKISEKKEEKSEAVKPEKKEEKLEQKEKT